MLSLFHLTAHFAVLSRSDAILFLPFIHTGKSTKLVWRADANPLASGYYHIDGKVPKWLEKAHLHVDGQTSQQVSAAVRAEQKSLIDTGVHSTGLNKYFSDTVSSGNNGQYLQNQQNSTFTTCQDGITRRTLTIVAGCGNDKADLEIRSSCSSDRSNFPKGIGNN